MTEDLVIMIISWLFVMFVFGFQLLMYRHGDRTKWQKNRRNPLYSIEGWAMFFGGAVIYALLRTTVVFEPIAMIANIPMVVTLFAGQFVFAGSLYLHWKVFPEAPSFYDWRDSRVTREMSNPDEQSATSE